MDLTDEELAEMEQWCDGPFYGWRIARLIAALRASREEVERLKGYDHAVRAAAAGPCAAGGLIANTC